MRNRLTQEEVEKRFLEKGLKLIGKYKNCYTKVETECQFCKKTFLAKPNGIFIGDIKSCGCQRDKLLTQIDIEQRALKYNIKIIGKYIGAINKIECICPLCNRIFLAVASEILAGRIKSCGCLSNFRDLTRITQQEAEKRSLDIGIKLVGQYIAQHRKTKFKCPVCKSIFLATPKSIWNKHIQSCGNCNYLNIKVGNKVGKHTIIKVEKLKYKGCYIEAQCECGEIWKGLRHNFIRHKGKACNKCGIKINGRIMMIEKGILTSSKTYLIHKMIDYQGIHNYRYGIYTLDIALVKNNQKIAIEYDEWYWHKNRKNSDRKKLTKLRQNKWKILQIKAKNNIPTQKQLDKALHELAFTNRKKYTIKLKGWIK